MQFGRFFYEGWMPRGFKPNVGLAMNTNKPSAAKPQLNLTFESPRPLLSKTGCFGQQCSCFCLSQLPVPLRCHHYQMLTEADTCRKYVVPKLQGAGWDNEPHSIAERRYFTDGRIVVRGNQSARDIMRKAKGLNGYLDRLPCSRSAAVLGCEFQHRPGTCSFRSTKINWRRDAATTRRRGRPRYRDPSYSHV
jgi:hypothetical protein